MSVASRGRSLGELGDEGVVDPGLAEHLRRVLADRGRPVAGAVALTVDDDGLADEATPVDVLDEPPGLHVRTVTVERGHDPRRFAMVAYGGALGVFGADIARTAGIRTVIVPGDAAVFSAHGLLHSDDVRTRARSASWAGGDVTPVAAGLRELDAQLVGALRAAGYDDSTIDVEWEGAFKYLGQQWELPVPIPRKDDLTEADLARARAEFPALYEAEYGSGTAWTGAPVVLMSVRVTATGRVATLEPRPHELPVDPPALPTPARRRVFLPSTGEEADVEVHDALALPAGGEIAGPAVVEHPLTAIQVPPGWRLRVDEWGNYVLTDTEGDQR